jgi:hypothetical protein
MKVIKRLVIFFLLVTSQVAGQGFSINPKYTLVTNNKYSSRELSLNFSYEIKSINLGLGLDFGYVNMYYDEHYWQTTNGRENKSFVGVSISYYPFNVIRNRVKPYLGVRSLLISDKNFSIGTSGHMIMDSGYYYPNAINDRILAFSIGSVLLLDKLNLIGEIGYEYRNFTFTYDEYKWTDDYIDLIKTEHSEEKFFNSFIITIGIQFAL